MKHRCRSRPPAQPHSTATTPVTPQALDQGPAYQPISAEALNRNARSLDCSPLHVPHSKHQHDRILHWESSPVARRCLPHLAVNCGGEESGSMLKVDEGSPLWTPFLQTSHQGPARIFQSLVPSVFTGGHGLGIVPNARYSRYASLLAQVDNRALLTCPCRPLPTTSNLFSSACRSEVVLYSARDSAVCPGSKPWARSASSTASVTKVPSSGLMMMVRARLLVVGAGRRVGSDRP